MAGSADPKAPVTDRRTRKTKKAIKDAFIELASGEGASGLTVKALAEKADISRKTFYAHYADIAAVAGDIENDMIERLLGLISAYDVDKFVVDPYPLFKRLTELLSGEASYYGRILSPDTTRAFLEKVKLLLKDMLLKLIFDSGTTINPTLMGFAADYIMGGLLTAYGEWLESDRRLSLEELSRRLGQITANGLRSIF